METYHDSRLNEKAIQIFARLQARQGVREWYTKQTGQVTCQKLKRTIKDKRDMHDMQKEPYLIKVNKSHGHVLNWGFLLNVNTLVRESGINIWSREWNKIKEINPYPIKVSKSHRQLIEWSSLCFSSTQPFSHYYIMGVGEALPVRW